MEDLVAKKIIKAWQRQKALHELWKPGWQEIAEYMCPNKSNILTIETPGAKRTTKLFDSTAISASDLLAASLQGSFTSRSSNWLALRIKNFGELEDKDGLDWLVEVTKIIHDELRQSNFYSEINEYYQDISKFATSNLFIPEPEPSIFFPGLRFKTISIGEYSINENADGRVDVVYRKFELSAGAAFDKWGKDLGEKTQKIATTKPEQLVPILHCVVPRDGKFSIGKSRLPFASFYIDLTTKTTITEGGFHEFPYIVTRWSKASGEIWGRGQGHVALPDTRSLNKVVYLKLKALAKAIDPPTMSRDKGVIGSVRNIPGGNTTVRDMDSIRPLLSGARFDVGSLVEGELQTAIRNMFFSDQLQLRDGPQMTATETQVRFELMQRFLGPTLGRLEDEGFNPMIKRIFNVLARAGRLPDVPESILLHRQQSPEGQGIIDIEYEGPLAQAQRQTVTASIQRFYQLALPISEQKQDVFDNIDEDKVIRLIANASQVPSTVMVSKEDVEEVRNARLKAAQEERVKAEQAQAVELLGKSAPVVQALNQPQNVPPLLAGV